MDFAARYRNADLYLVLEPRGTWSTIRGEANGVLGAVIHPLRVETHNR